VVLLLGHFPSTYLRTRHIFNLAYKQTFFNLTGDHCKLQPANHNKTRLLVSFIYLRVYSRAFPEQLQYHWSSESQRTHCWTHPCWPGHSRV